MGFNDAFAQGMIGAIIVFTVILVFAFYIVNKDNKESRRVYTVMWFKPFDKVWDVFGTTRDIDEALRWGENLSRFSTRWYITYYLED